jgi:hypothetical protein
LDEAVLARQAATVRLLVEKGGRKLIEISKEVCKPTVVRTDAIFVCVCMYFCTLGVDLKIARAIIFEYLNIHLNV